MGNTSRCMLCGIATCMETWWTMLTVRNELWQQTLPPQTSKDATGCCNVPTFGLTSIAYTLKMNGRTKASQEGFAGMMTAYCMWWKLLLPQQVPASQDQAPARWCSLQFLIHIRQHVDNDREHPDDDHPLRARRVEGGLLTSCEDHLHS